MLGGRLITHQYEVSRVTLDEAGFEDSGVMEVYTNIEEAMAAADKLAKTFRQGKRKHWVSVSFVVKRLMVRITDSTVTDSEILCIVQPRLRWTARGHE